MNHVGEKERLFKAFANKRRLAVIHYLRTHGRKSVGDIAGHLKLSLGATSRHLSLLIVEGVIDSEQEGLLVYYFLSPNPSPTVQKALSIC